MKKNVIQILSILLACCLLCATLCIPALAADTGEFDPPDNLVRNPGFEAGEAEWEICPTDPKAWFNTGIYKDLNPHSGDYSALLGSHIGDWAYISQEIDIPEPGYYELHAFVLDINANSTVYMIIEDLNTGEQYTTEYSDLSQDWNELELQVELNNPECRITFAIEKELLLIDDVSLVPIDPPAPEPVQLLQNTSFESSLTNWTQQGEPCAFITDSQARSGKNSLYMGYFQNEGLQNYVEQTCSSSSGSYQFTAWIKTDKSLSGIGAALFLEAREQNGKVLSVATSLAVGDSGGGWQKASVQMDAPSGTASITAKIGGVYCTGAFYVDDAQLMYQPE